MGCSLCKEERCPDTKRSISVAKNYFNKKNQKLDRVGTQDAQNRVFTSQIYKQKLIDLITQKRDQNEKKLQREQETYLTPFQQIADETKPSKYESLVLNMLNAKRKAEDIMRNQRPSQEEEQEGQETQELDDMFQKMVFNDYCQSIYKQYKKKQDSTFFQSYHNNHQVSQVQNNFRQSVTAQISPPYLTAIGNQVFSENGNLSHQASNEQGNSMNQQFQLEKAQSCGGRPRYSHGISMNSSSNYQIMNFEQALHSERPQQLSLARFDSGFQNNQIQINEQRFLHSMVDMNQEYQTATIQLQKYLFNYLYGKVSNNQHIVRSLIDKFGDLIWEKFYPIFDNFQYYDFQDGNLSNSSVDCLRQIQICIENDIKYLINLIKEYLQSIYGENVIPEKLFTLEQQDKIFDIFVRKIVFDNSYICQISQLSLSKVNIQEYQLLQSFFGKVRDKLTIQNAFIVNNSLKFLSNYTSNPFAQLDEQLIQLQTISSPFLKKIQIKNFINATKKLLDQLQKEQLPKEQLKELNINELLLIYYFIFVQTSVNIYHDLKFIETYTKENNSGNDFVNVFYEIFEDLLNYAQNNEVQKFVDIMFYDSIEKNNQIDEEDESFSISQTSRLSNHQIGNEFLFQNDNQQKSKLNQGILGIINQQSASSHTITECLGEGNGNSNNYQLIFSNSDILTTTAATNKKDKTKENKMRSSFSQKPTEQIDEDYIRQMNNRSIFCEESQLMIQNTAAHSSMHMEEDQNAKLE